MAQIIKDLYSSWEYIPQGGDAQKNTESILIRWQTARRSNQSILKEISPEYSLEGLILKLKLQYYGHLM